MLRPSAWHCGDNERQSWRNGGLKWKRLPTARQPYASTAERFPAPVSSLKVNVSLPSLCIWIKSLMRVASRIMEEGLFMTIGTLSVSTPLKTMSLPSPATTLSLHWRMRPHKPLATLCKNTDWLNRMQTLFRWSQLLGVQEWTGHVTPENQPSPFLPALTHSFCFLVSVWLFGTLTWQGEIYCSHSPCFSLACSHCFQIVMDLLKNLARRLHAYRDSRLLDRAVSAEVGFLTTKCNK